MHGKVLQCLTGQYQENCALTEKLGSVDRLYHFYAGFDQYFSGEVDTKEEMFLGLVKAYTPITVSGISSICLCVVNKASRSQSQYIFFII